MSGPYDSEWWEKTEAQLRAWYPHFYHKLNVRYPNLTPNEVKLCSLLLMKHTSNDLADILGITIESLHTACHRLRKRMDVPHSVKLYTHLAAIAESDGGGKFRSAFDVPALSIVL
ncbi:MAG TPA: hypothetical protein VFH95_02735 [Candidatus Kapabacteria bacterium]|nr:hypothetical protein [Candidatus Kapabacteria bacterium]